MGRIVLKMERQRSGDTVTTLRMPDGSGVSTTEDTLSDMETIIARIENASRDQTPLTSINDPASRQAIAVIPGPGMSFRVMPWADHLEEIARSQAAAERPLHRMNPGRIAVPGRRG